MQRLERGLWVAAGTLVLGTGVGLVALGRRRGFLWLAAIPLVAFAALLCAPLVWLAVVVHAGSAIDAFVTGAREPQPARWRQPAVIAVPLALVMLGLAFRAFVVEAYRVPSSAMAPTITVGDHVLVDKLTPHVAANERGDIVVHRYPCARDLSHLKRVVALAGDTVEVRCDVLYINGKAVPRVLVPGTCTYADRDDREDRWFMRDCTQYRETIGDHTFDMLVGPARDGHEPGPHDFPLANQPVPSCALIGEAQIPQTLGTIEAGPQPANACAPQLHYVVPAGHVFTMGDNRYNSNDSRYFGAVPLADITGRVSGIWLTTGQDGYTLSRAGRVH